MGASRNRVAGDRLRTARPRPRHHVGRRNQEAQLRDASSSISSSTCLTPCLAHADKWPLSHRTGQLACAERKWRSRVQHVAQTNHSAARIVSDQTAATPCSELADTPSGKRCQGLCCHLDARAFSPGDAATTLSRTSAQPSGGGEDNPDRYGRLRNHSFPQPRSKLLEWLSGSAADSLRAAAGACSAIDRLERRFKDSEIPMSADSYILTFSCPTAASSRVARALFESAQHPGANQYDDIKTNLFFAVSG